jgi:hypothetical protein
VQFKTVLLPDPEYASMGQVKQAVSDVCLICIEYLPLGHFVHGSEPFTSLYDPATHAAHDAPSGPEYPRRQVQLSKCQLPSTLDEFKGHARHAVLTIAAISLLYFPAEHMVHV